MEDTGPPVGLYTYLVPVLHRPHQSVVIIILKEADSNADDQKEQGRYCIWFLFPSVSKNRNGIMVPFMNNGDRGPGSAAQLELSVCASAPTG